jgi:hypothetical protein
MVGASLRRKKSVYEHGEGVYDSKELGRIGRAFRGQGS